MTYDPDDDRPPTLPGATSRRRRARTPVAGVSVLDDTTDDGAPLARAAGRIEAAAAQIQSSAIWRDAKRAELATLPGSEWARRVDADIAAIRAAIARPNRARVMWTLVRAIGLGGLLTALVLVARALIAHGDGSAQARDQAERVRRHEVEIHRLQQQQAADDEAHGRRMHP